MANPPGALPALIVARSSASTVLSGSGTIRLTLSQRRRRECQTHRANSSQIRRRGTTANRCGRDSSATTSAIRLRELNVLNDTDKCQGSIFIIPNSGRELKKTANGATWSNAARPTTVVLTLAAGVSTTPGECHHRYCLRQNRSSHNENLRIQHPREFQQFSMSS